MKTYSDKTNLYNELKESNDCFVRSLAIAANIPYVESHSICENLFNRKTGEGTNVGPDTLVSEEIQNFFKERFLELIPVNHTYVRKDKRVHTLNIRGFYNRYRKGTYLLMIPNHAMVIKDGEMLDWDTHTPHIGRKIIRAYRVKNNRQLVLFND